MSWIALVGPEIEENLSLRYLAASLGAAGYRSEIIPFNGDRDFGTALATILQAPEPPLCVGLSLAFQWRAQDFLALAVALRQGGYRGHICVGGHFATFASRDILADFAEVDTVVRQEAEQTLVALVRALETRSPLGEIPGLCVRDAAGRPVLTAQPALPDLARLPPPDRRGPPASCFGHRIAPLVSSRGCYANCTFCCIAAWHEESQPGKRYRVREVAEVADEMARLHHERGIDVFVFHDDNFFVPGHRKNLARFTALADALEARGVRRFATVVKARPTDVDPEVFRVLVERLQCIRVYIGIETDADQGLRTLRRWSGTKQNRAAIRVVRELELYTCFNMLIFDPDTTVESLQTNIAFMRFAAESPSNFGRVELYAGTPLLDRMLAEGRCRGDYMQWDYALASEPVERIFELTMRCFHDRNFGDDALNNRIMGTRFDIEVCRHFHPDAFRPEWLAEGKELSRRLAHDSCDALDAIVARVKQGAPEADDEPFVDAVSRRLRATERDIAARCKDLARRIHAVIGGGRPLTDIGDRVATPLQTQRLAAPA